jgi:hypothetical protein
MLLPSVRGRFLEQQYITHYQPDSERSNIQQAASPPHSKNHAYSGERPQIPLKGVLFLKAIVLLQLAYSSFSYNSLLQGCTVPSGE